MNDQQKEKARALAQHALELGRKKQSAFSGFLHLTQENSEVIPVLENFSFALALFRSKTAENIQEGKRLLEKLLHFQISHKEARGHFPVFLHEYPYARDTFFAIKLLPVLYQIYSDFGSVLGQKLKRKLFLSMQKLLTLSEKEEFSPSYQFTLSVMQHLLGKNPADVNLQKLLEHKGDLNAEDWGRALIAASLASETLFLELQEEAQFFYHESCRAFIGPSHNEPYDKFRQQISLFDLFQGKCAGDDLVYLHGALIKPIEQAPAKPNMLIRMPSKLGFWKIFRGSSYSFAVLEENAERSFQKNAHVLRILFGDGHSLVCQDFASKVASTVSADEIELHFTLPEAFTESKEDYEIAFHLDSRDEMEFTVDCKRATTFQLGSLVEIKKKNFKIDLSFSQVSGNGRFFGHLLKGNRPSQTFKPTKTDFTAYDWKIALRTLARNGSCQIALRLRVQQLS